MRWHLVWQSGYVFHYNMALRTFQLPAAVSRRRISHLKRHSAVYICIHSVSALISCWAIGKVCWSPSKITWYDPVARPLSSPARKLAIVSTAPGGADCERERYLLWQEVVNWNSAAINSLGAQMHQAPSSLSSRAHTNEFPTALSQNLAHQND